MPTRWIAGLSSWVLLFTAGCSSNTPKAEHEGTPRDKATATQEGAMTAGLWVDLDAQVRIPLGDVETATGEYWLNVSVSRDATSGDVFFEGCTSSVAGACAASWRTTLSDSAAQGFAEHMVAVLSMPRCEPLAFAPEDFPFELAMGSDARSGHIPATWFDAAGPDARRSEPCFAEVSMAFWLYETWYAMRPPEGG